MYNLNYKKLAMTGFLSVSVVACARKENNYLITEKEKADALNFTAENFTEINSVVMETNGKLSQEDQAIFKLSLTKKFMQNFPKVFGLSKESLYIKYPEKIDLINSTYAYLIEISELSEPEQENIYNSLIKRLLVGDKKEESFPEKKPSKQRKYSSDSSGDEREKKTNVNNNFLDCFSGNSLMDYNENED